MNGMRPNGRTEKPVPGCLGRVVNLFDLTSGMTRNKLLTDKPYRDVSPLSRSRSDVSRTSSPICEEVEDKMIVSDMRRSSSTKNLEGTPAKMILAQDMSKRLESGHSSPNVVAKLMGLDVLPEQHQLPDFGRGRSISRCRSQSSDSDIPIEYWQQEDGSFVRAINFENHQCQEQFKYKDVYEIWQPSPQTNYMGSLSAQKGRCNDYTSEKKLALVRQKFMEAKRLSTDEKLRQTKEFQDALEVLSSNQDLFLKILQEPNSLISDHLYGQQPTPPPPETKRITVLRPSKMVFGGEKQLRKSPTREQANGKDSHHCRFSPSVATWKAEEYPTQPTQIVVLKPSIGRILDGKADLRQTKFTEEPVDDETREAREVAKEITQQMRENLAGHRKDDTLLSSVFSNGYIGDESSFNKSEAEFVVGNLSDSEVMSRHSRHAWDYVDRCGSPYSCSSFGHASYSSESSVCREAKKRLSERWTMMESSRTGGEQGHIRRSSSTLGEMLAVSDVRKSEIFEVEDCNRGQDSRASTSFLASKTGEGEIESPRSLTRSKSLPVSSTASGQRFNIEALDPRICRTDGLKTKSSFRGKVTSIFFSRIKKSSKEKTANSSTHAPVQPESLEISTSPAPFGVPLDNNFKSSVSEEAQSPEKSRQGISSKQAALSLPNPAAVQKLGENQDHPSPISVLDPSFEEDGNINTIMGSSSTIAPEELDKHFSLGKSNLINKSSPIGSIARTLSREEPRSEAATSNPLKSSVPSPKERPEEEGELLLLVQSLLSAACLDNEYQLSWHSPESPLDPWLRDTFVELVPSHGAKWRQLRSIRQLVFDFVNATLVDMTTMGSIARPPRTVLVDRVWAQVKEWLWMGGSKAEGMWLWFEEDGADSNSLAAEKVVRKELTGKRWADEVRLEVEMLGKKIEGKLLEELVMESVGEWTGIGCC